MFSILIVEVTRGRWSYAIAKGDRRVFSSPLSWTSPELAWSDALPQYELARHEDAANSTADV